MAAAVLLGGCAIPPPKSALRPVAQPASFATSQSFAASRADWPSDAWWTAFGDPQLDALIKEGLVGATDLRVAEARFARARALVRQSRSSLLPSVSASAEGGVMQQSEHYLSPPGFAPRGWPDYGQASLSLNWELDFWGKNRAALAATKSEAEAAGAEAAAARLAVSAGIASAYADLAGLYAERDAAQRAVDIRGQTRDLMAGRMKQGLENQGAVERAASAQATAQGDLAALDENIALTGNRIAALMGTGPDRGLSIARPAINAPCRTGRPRSTA